MVGRGKIIPSDKSINSFSDPRIISIEILVSIVSASLEHDEVDLNNLYLFWEVDIPSLHFPLGQGDPGPVELIWLFDSEDEHSSKSHILRHC